MIKRRLVVIDIAFLCAIIRLFSQKCPDPVPFVTSAPLPDKTQSLFYGKLLKECPKGYDEFQHDPTNSSARIGNKPQGVASTASVAQRLRIHYVYLARHVSRPSEGHLRLLT